MVASSAPAGVSKTVVSWSGIGYRSQQVILSRAVGHFENGMGHDAYSFRNCNALGEPLVSCPRFSTIDTFGSGTNPALPTTGHRTWREPIRNGQCLGFKRLQCHLLSEHYVPVHELAFGKETQTPYAPSVLVKLFDVHGASAVVCGRYGR